MASPTKKTRVFISFDYDHDNDLRIMLVGQARHQNTPFAFEDWSVKRAARGWKEDARGRIGRSDVVIVICGHNTNTAVGVEAEIKIAREEDVPFWLLRGRKSGDCRRPKGTSWFSDEMHDWTWGNIESMCRSKTTPWWKRIW